LLRYFLSAISFLTIIPVPKRYRQEMKHLLPFFPIVGFFIGIIFVLINYCCSFVFYKIVVDFLVVVSLIIITGGLHLDGLADFLDGFYAGDSKDEIIKIMDDSHIGAMGVIGIVVVILAKFILFNNLDNNMVNASLVLFPVLGRWSMVVSMGISQPAKEDGLGNFFLKNTTKNDFIISVIITFLLVFFVFKLKGIVIFLFISFFSFIFTKYIIKKIKGITGDTLGAVCEMSEVFTLLILNLK